MSVSAPVLAIAGVVALAAVLVAKLFWPAPAPAPDADDRWRQHNELRQPSLERGPQAADTEVDAAIAAQINGVD